MTRTRKTEKNQVGVVDDGNDVVDEGRPGDVQEIEQADSHHSNRNEGPSDKDDAARIDRLEGIIQKLAESQAELVSRLAPPPIPPVPLQPPPLISPQTPGGRSNDAENVTMTEIPPPVSFEDQQPHNKAGPSRLEKGKGIWRPEGGEEEVEEVPPPRYAREIEVMNRRIDELSRGKSRYEDIETASRHPFIPQIMDEPLPASFRHPSLEPYNASSDPMDHLANYNCSMALQGVSDAILCRAFPSTLKGFARAWYSSLGPFSIRDFTDLSRHLWHILRAAEDNVEIRPA